MKIYSVSEITAQIKELLESEFPGVWVEGEVTDYKVSPSGHLYFSLKDEFALLSCIIWRENRTLLTVEIKNGKKVRVYGRLRVYVKGGKYNLQVEKVYPIGIGELQIKFEELKQRLKKEGLFEAIHKKPLPEWVECIGIITALDGAALWDIIKVAKRRYPGVKIIVRASPVQGEGAAEEIAKGIIEFNQFNQKTDYGVDLLIVGRGGGSIEDLWAFNEEIVARAIYDSEIPIISAVGHDVDWTIADLVADYRAPTPSVAAEIAIKEQKRVMDKLESLESQMTNSIKRKIDAFKEKIAFIEKSYGIKRLIDLIYDYWQTIDELEYKLNTSFTHPLVQKKAKFNFIIRRFFQEENHFLFHQKRELQSISLRLINAIQSYMKNKDQKMKIIETKLLNMSPKAILQRGYSICYKLPEKRVVKDSKILSQYDKIKVELFRGSAECEVKEIEN
jgi:exodeoxyribonuclease VII large subunit